MRIDKVLYCKILLYNNIMLGDLGDKVTAFFSITSYIRPFCQ